jgi:hypothetical protein
MISYKLPRYFRIIDQYGRCCRIYREEELDGVYTKSDSVTPVSVKIIYENFCYYYYAVYIQKAYTEEEITEAEVFMELL